MENLTARQRDLVARVQARLGTRAVRWDDARGVASVLRGELLPPAGLGADAGARPEAVLRRFLEEYGPLIGPAEAADRLRFSGARRSPHGHVRIRAQQFAEGVPIHGATLLLFVDEKRGVFRAQSGCYRDVAVPELVAGGRPVDPAERARGLQRRLRTALEKDPEGTRFIDRKLSEGFGNDAQAAEYFPMAGPPELCLFPASEGLRHAFRVSAYQPVEWLGVNGETRHAIDMADLVIDVLTGRTVYRSSRLGAWADVAADGRSTLQQGGSYVIRPLAAVQEDGADRLLVNRGNTPHIVTHDAGGTETGLETKLANGTDVSRDADGHWNATTTSCTAANRRDAQQPETDAHFHVQEAFAYYQGLGWTGFDNGEWGTAPCVVRVAAHIGMDDNAYFWRYIQNGRHYGYLAFFDGACTGTTLDYDFMAGDPLIVAHEFQHAVTYFGAVDSAGNPGYLQTDGWHRAIHEGLSDTFAGLRTETWITPALWPDGACRNSLPFRRIEYPRSNATKNAVTYCDHYDDRFPAGDSYRNSTILSHAVFLAGQGGVHERTSRPAVLIPVPGVGCAAIAAVVHYAVTELFDNIPANSGGGHCMIEAANLILDAAEELTGTTRSCEYVRLRRAFYAVGLYPYNASFTKVTYGGEACMLPWTISWRHSREYLGFPALWYKSPDLFINNGAGPDYDAEVGSENALFARVRNIGDQDLTNVVVRFYFRAHGTNLPSSSTQWKACTNSAGTPCVLTIPTLAAGSMNFTDPNNPPAAQAVQWYLDPAEIVAGIDHFCVRAEIECAAANHDNDCPNYVQSNVSHSQPETGTGLELAFRVANWQQEPVRLDVEVDTRSLPRRATVEYLDRPPLEEVRLKPREERVLRWKVSLPAPRGVSAPYDGEVRGEVSSRELKGPFEGVLSQAAVSGPAPATGETALSGQVAGTVDSKHKLVGAFKGVLVARTGALTGSLTASVYSGRRKPLEGVRLRIKAQLRPTRAVHFSQRVAGRVVGGVTYDLTPKKWPA